MIDIRTMLKQGMNTQNELFGASARVHNYYANDSISKPIQSRQMYQHRHAHQQARPLVQQVRAKPPPQPMPQHTTKQNLDEFYFYYTYLENGRTYVVFKKSVFLLMLLTISIGIGVLALDVRRLMLFLAKGLQASLASIIS